MESHGRCMGPHGTARESHGTTWDRMGLIRTTRESQGAAWDHMGPHGTALDHIVIIFLVYYADGKRGGDKDMFKKVIYFDREASVL